MTTWNTVTVVGLEAASLTIDQLPDIYEPYLHDGDGVDGNHWDHGFEWVASTEDEPAHMKAVTDEAYVAGHSKYRVEEIETWIKQFTAEHPELTIEWDQTWDDDDAGREVTIWRKGELVRGESQVSALVPMDYVNLIQEGRDALARLSEAAEGDSNDEEIDAGQAVAAILSTLIEGITT